MPGPNAWWLDPTAATLVLTVVATLIAYATTLIIADHRKHRPSAHKTHRRR